MNPYNQQRPDANMAKMLLKQYYRDNKILVYIMLAFTVALLGLGMGFHSLYFVSLLYLGGTLFKRYLGDHKLVSTLIFGGLSGAVVYASFFIQDQNILHMFIVLLTSAIMAVFVGVGTYSPNFEILFFGAKKIKLKYIVIAFTLLGLVSARDQNAYQISIIGGAIYGFLSIYFRGNNPYSSKKPSFFSNLFKAKKKKPYVKKENKASKESKQTRKEKDEEYNKRKQSEQNEIDGILDKVKLNGYESLSAAEKQKLFDKSK